MSKRFEELVCRCGINNGSSDVEGTKTKRDVIAAQILAHQVDNSRIPQMELLELDFDELEAVCQQVKTESGRVAVLLEMFRKAGCDLKLWLRCYTNSPSSPIGKNDFRGQVRSWIKGVARNLVFDEWQLVRDTLDHSEVDNDLRTMAEDGMQMGAKTVEQYVSTSRFVDSKDDAAKQLYLIGLIGRINQLYPGKKKEDFVRRFNKWREIAYTVASGFLYDDAIEIMADLEAITRK